MAALNNFKTNSVKINDLTLTKGSKRVNNSPYNSTELNYDEIDYGNFNIYSQSASQMEADRLVSLLRVGDPLAADFNTQVLQEAINKLAESGGGTINLPAGEIYFGQGGTASNGERFAILCRSNVHIKGSGTTGESQTILKPIRSFTAEETSSMDMFFFNHYSTGNPQFAKAADGTNFDYNHKVNYTYTGMDGNPVEITNDYLYLTNADFSDFVIDGSEVKGNKGPGMYTSAGKGFMINLFKDCDWNNVVVKNTDATGFGMDCPINCTITNCTAIGCGKQASETDGGASGFGIGTGYSNDESIKIINCEAYNNKKYGIFFEHQSRFQYNKDIYPATSSNGFLVANCKGGGNLYNFGGIKAYDVTFRDIMSVTDITELYNRSNTLVATPLTYRSNSYSNVLFNNSSSHLEGVIASNTKQHIYFSDYSVNCHIENGLLDSNITDLYSYGYEITRAINAGYISLKNMNEFGSKDELSRMDVMEVLYKYCGMPSPVNVTGRKDIGNDTLFKIQEYNGSGTNFSDLKNDNYTNESGRLDSVLWGVSAGIVTPNLNFNPTSNCSRSQVITMLYRMAGSPKVSGEVPFTDIENNSWYSDALTWAYQSGIIKGISETEFAPNGNLTKEQLAIILSRYTDLTTPSLVSPVTYL